MTKADTNCERVSKQRNFAGQEAQPDTKGEKVWHSKANNPPNNKPIPNK